MNLITESWRLKLLAIGLSVLMLGAVAFAQNPRTFRTITVSSIQYSVPSNLIVINAPTKTTVRVTGLADTIQSLAPTSLVASFDLSKSVPGPAVKVNLVVKSLVGNVTVQNPSVPVALDIDTRATVRLAVQVRPPRAVPGWVVTKAEARCGSAPPCFVNFDGPTSWETDSKGQPNLKAYVDFTAPVSGDTIDAVNLSVVLEQNGNQLDPANFAKTVPNAGLDVSAFGVHIEAKTGTTSKQVVLIDSPPTHGPPSGYRVTAIAINPIAVVISGRGDLLGTITTLRLPAVDLSSSTADVSFRITIPYPSGVTGQVLTARVTYSISANPNVQPSP